VFSEVPAAMFVSAKAE